MRLRSKLAALAVTAGVAVTATAAFAYWTTTGSGSGNAVAKSSNGTITLHASFGADITPGGSKNVSFSADNPGTTNLWVENLAVDGISVSNAYDATTNASGCKASDFSVESSNIVQQTMIAAGQSGVALPNGTVLRFANSSQNQDGCKGATVTLSLSSN